MEQYAQMRMNAEATRLEYLHDNVDGSFVLGMRILSFIAQCRGCFSPNELPFFGGEADRLEGDVRERYPALRTWNPTKACSRMKQTNGEEIRREAVNDAKKEVV
jgi:hypothetical protein